MMLRLRTVPLALVFLLGCDADAPEDPAPGGDNSASDSDTDGASDTDADSGGGSSTGSPLPTTAGGSGSTTGSDDSTGTGAGAACDLVDFVTDAVEGGMVSSEDIVDCGTVQVDDEPSVWLGMQTCVLDAAANEQAYIGFVHRANGLFEAFGAVLDTDYRTQHWLATDSGKVFMERCSEPTVLPDCDAGTEMGTCIVCFGEGNQVCP